MILKIKRYEKAEEWYIIDNIKKISISHTLLKRPGCEDHIEIVIFDIHSDSKCTCDGENTGCSHCQKYVRLICTSTDDTEFGIVFDTMAYVLNDDGKTIDRIIANDPK